jgi:hypothetical protein
MSAFTRARKASGQRARSPSMEVMRKAGEAFSCDGTLKQFLQLWYCDVCYSMSRCSIFAAFLCDIWSLRWYWKFRYYDNLIFNHAIFDSSHIYIYIYQLFHSMTGSWLNVMTLNLIILIHPIPRS